MNAISEQLLNFVSPALNNVITPSFDDSIPPTFTNFFDHQALKSIPLISLGHLNEGQIKKVLDHYRIKSVEVEAKHLMGYKYLKYINKFWINEKIIFKPFSSPISEERSPGISKENYLFSYDYLTPEGKSVEEGDIWMLAHEKEPVPVTVYYCKELDHPLSDLAYHQTVIKLMHEQLRSPRKKSFDIYSPQQMANMKMQFAFADYIFIYTENESGHPQFLTAPSLDIQGMFKYYRQLLLKDGDKTTYYINACSLAFAFKADEINEDGTLVDQDASGGFWKRLNQALADGVLPTQKMLILNHEWHQHQVKLAKPTDYDLSVPKKLYWVKNGSLSWSLYGSQTTGDVELFWLRIASYKEVDKYYYFDIISPMFKDIINIPVSAQTDDNEGCEIFCFKNGAEYLSTHNDPEGKANLSDCTISESNDEDDYTISVDQSGNQYCKMADENHPDLISFKEYIEEIIMELFTSYQANNN